MVRVKSKKRCSKFNFVTIGDKNFYHIIKISIAKIRKLYPKSKIIVYDWGFTPQQYYNLISISNVVVRHWKFQLPEDISFSYLKLKQKLKVMYDVVPKLICRKIPLVECYMTNKILNREIKFVNKFLCLQDYVDVYGTNFIFLDGDAVLTQKIDEVLKMDFDVGVTIRRVHEFDFTIGNCQLLNAGVLFFLGGYEKNKRFMNMWHQMIKDTDEPLREQTALSRLLQYRCPGIYKQYAESGIDECNISGVKIKILPCDPYNYNWVEEEPKKAKVLHFKGNRHTPEQFEILRKKVGLEE